MKKIMSIVCALALVSTLTACGSSSADSSETVKIGVNYELSGAVASYGEAINNGLSLAFDEINANGGVLDGKTIETVTYDNKSDNSEVVSLATKLATSDLVSLILGPATSGAFKSEIPVSTQYKVPVISCSSTSDTCLVQADGTIAPYGYRTCFNDSFQGVSIANFAYEDLNATKAVILGDVSSDYAVGLTENFVSTFEAAGGVIVAEEKYTTGDTDFNSIITKLSSLDYDVLFIPGYYQEAGLIIKQFRSAGNEQPILGADGFDSDILTELAGESNLHDVYYSSHYSALNPSETMSEFIVNYTEKYGSEPNTFSALGYDMAYFAADCIKRAGSADTEAINDAIASTVNFEGITGAFSMDEDHNPVKYIFIIELDEGVAVSSTIVSPE